MTVATLTRSERAPDGAADRSWRVFANCRSDAGRRAADKAHDGPESGPGIDFARTWCQPCPVREECLVAALAAGEPSGVWGGLSPSQRRLLAVQGWQTCGHCGRKYAPRNTAQQMCTVRCRRAHEMWLAWLEREVS